MSLERGGFALCTRWGLEVYYVRSLSVVLCCAHVFPYACWAWPLIWAVVRDQLSCAVLSNVLLKVIPSIRVLGTKSTPKSFPVPIHPPIARALFLDVQSLS